MNRNQVSLTVRASRAAVYRACSEPADLVRWRFPLDMTARLLSVEGARYRMTLGYRDGRADSFEAVFVERVPNERVVELIRFDAADRAGEMTVTTELSDVGDGTEVTMRFENLPESIRPEDNEDGTQQALVRLARLVEG